MEKLLDKLVVIVFDLWKKPMLRLALMVVVMVVVSGATAAFYYNTQIPPEQPIQFTHKVHVGLGIPCLYCHPGAWRQASAGLPTEQKCWACHGQLAKYWDPKNPVPVSKWPVELQKLADYVQRKEPIKWVPVYQVPDFVHFNHRPHIAAGLNCENCHGDMSKKTVATVEQTVNMGWCLNCHRSRTENNTQNNPTNSSDVAAELAEKRTKLLDCGTCHY
jgi:hypothetical protein